MAITNIYNSLDTPSYYDQIMNMQLLNKNLSSIYSNTSIGDNNFQMPDVSSKINNQFNKIAEGNLDNRKEILSLQDRLQRANDLDLSRLEKRALKKQLSAREKLDQNNGDISALSTRDRVNLGVTASELENDLNNRASTINSVGNVLGSLGSMLPKTKLRQTDEVKAADQAFDTTANAVSQMGPYGAIAGGIMKAGGFVSDALTSMGVGTDQMTAADKILDSKFLKLTPFGLANALGAKRANSITADESTLAQVGSAYGNDIQNALKYSGKKYGLFSRSKRRKANALIAEANRQQKIMADISDKAKSDFAAQAQMTDVYSNAESFNSSGGFNERMSIGKQGMKIFGKDQINKTKQLLAKHSNPVLKDRTLEELKKYADKQNPNFIQRLHESTLRTIKLPRDKDGNSYMGSHLLSYGQVDNEYIIYPNIQEIDGQLTLFIDPKEAIDSAIKNKDYIKVNSKNEAELFTTKYKTVYPIFQTIQYKNGGKMNVIPDGALHARLHHMDIDDITKKGIPVVIKKEDGEVEQQAEIERDEIIFNLELTQKLEKLWKDGSDGAAIEAGKILAEEILHNTIDNTGLINKIEL